MKLFIKNSEDEKKEDKLKLEGISKSYNFTFPPLYYFFQTHFKIGQYLEEWDTYLDKYLRPTPIFKATSNSDKETGGIYYNWLLSPNQILHSLKFYDKTQDILLNKKMLRIGDFVNKGGLFLGLDEGNRDKVFRYIYDIDKEPILLSNHIFEFLNDLKISKINPDLNLVKPTLSKYWLKIDEPFEYKKEELTKLSGQIDHLETKFISFDIFIKGLKKSLKDVQNINI